MLPFFFLKRERLLLEGLLLLTHDTFIPEKIKWLTSCGGLLITTENYMPFFKFIEICWTLWENHSWGVDDHDDKKYHWREKLQLLFWFSDHKLNWGKEFLAINPLDYRKKLMWCNLWFFFSYSMYGIIWKIIHVENDSDLEDEATWCEVL